MFISRYFKTNQLAPRVIEYITLFKQGDATLEARKDLLREQLDTIAKRLHEIQHTYDLIKDKSEHYETHVEGYHGKLLK